MFWAAPALLVLLAPPAALSLPAAPEVTNTVQGQTLRFARIGDGLIGPYRLQTSVVFLNHSAKKGTITLEPFSEAGTPASLNWGSGPTVKTTIDVPAGGAVELTSDGSTNPAVIGWANASTENGTLNVQVGFVEKRPSDPQFQSELDAEISRLRTFLRRGGN